MKAQLLRRNRHGETLKAQLLWRNSYCAIVEAQVRPSLLHGDLWSGNMTGVKEGGWAILDPATYYGHSEAEFGMSWCAGFDRSFWDGYFEVLPPAPGTCVFLPGELESCSASSSTSR